MKRRISKTIAVSLIALIIILCLASGCNSSPSASYDWILRTIQENYYEDIPEDVLHKSILSGGLSSVLDKYSAYYTEEEYAQVAASNSGSKSGIGISYQFLPDGVSARGSGVLVTDVLGGSPSYASGLKTGTFIQALRLGDKVTSVTTSADFSSFITARATGEKFTLVTDRGEYEVSKEEYTASYCVMSTSEKTYSIYYQNGKMTVDEEEAGIPLLPEGAAYLRLDQFYGNAVEEFLTLMQKYTAENCTSLILDLRQNGGGYVDVMCDISGILVGQSNVKAMSATYKNGSSRVFVTGDYSKRCSFPQDSKLSVLADNGTASASEALIGALISYGVIDYSDVYISDFSESYLEFSGTAEKNCRTYGKGIMQSTFTNRTTREVLKLTTAKIYWPDGTCIHDIGLTAEKCKTVETDWCVTYGDEQLARAIAMIYS